LKLTEALFLVKLISMTAIVWDSQLDAICGARYTLLYAKPASSVFVGNFIPAHAGHEL